MHTVLRNAARQARAADSAWHSQTVASVATPAARLLTVIVVVSFKVSKVLPHAELGVCGASVVSPELHAPLDSLLNRQC